MKFPKTKLLVPSVAALALLLAFATYNLSYAATPRSAFYVSPKGSDTNPGSSDRPWKTVYKAAQTLSAGQTATLEDGTYNETQLTRFANAGKNGAPITLKARNKQKAHIHYVGNQNTMRMYITSPYVTIQDLEITADNWTNPTTRDILVAFGKGADNGRAIGNKIHHVYEDALKVSHVGNFYAEGNEVYDTEHEGYDAVSIWNSQYIGNRVHNVGRVGLFAKGGSRNVIFKNNLVDVTKGERKMLYGLSLGGSTGALSTYDVKGSEGYNLVAQNNVILVRSGASIRVGLSSSGCSKCGIYNNNVIGAGNGIELRNGGDPVGSLGQAPWIATNKDLTLQNNVFYKCPTTSVRQTNTVQGKFVSDHNVFFASLNPPAGSSTADPQFNDAYSDWHVKLSSSLLDRGVALTTHPTYSDANTPSIPAYDLQQDRNGAQRTNPWDIGVYNLVKPATVGLNADYYKNKTLSGTPALRRVDEVVDFDWGKSAPAPGFPVDAFSVRWTGYVTPATTEEYTFYALANDGVRLRVDGKLLVDRWKDASASKEGSAKIKLTANKKYPIVMEYYDNTGDAAARLRWSSATVTKQVISIENLSH